MKTNKKLEKKESICTYNIYVVAERTDVELLIFGEKNPRAQECALLENSVDLYTKIHD